MIFVVRKLFFHWIFAGEVIILAEIIKSESALGHLRVIELGDIPASYATRQFADLGADVIKVEPPGGDPNRLLPPFAGNIEHPERSLTFINANTNKRSIVLDLERESDREIFANYLRQPICLSRRRRLGIWKSSVSTTIPCEHAFPLGDRLDHALWPHRTLSSLQRQRCHRQRDRRISLRPRRQQQRPMHGAEPSRLSVGRDHGRTAGFAALRHARVTGAGSASTSRYRRP